MELDLVVTVQQQEADSDGKLKDFLEYATKTVRNFVKIIVEDDTAGLESDHLSGTVLADKTRSGNIGIIYQTAMSGESDSTPHVRPPRFRADHFKKRVKACCKVRGDPDSIDDQFIFFMFDAGRHGNDRAIGECIVKDDCKVMSKKYNMTYYVQYEESSLTSRKGNVRGYVNQMEMMQVFTGIPVAKLLPDAKPRKHFQGTTHGSCIGPVAVPQYKEMWRTTKDDKSKLLGFRGKIPAGGPANKDSANGGADDPSDPTKYEKPEFKDGMHPVNWHATGEALIEELIHSFDLKLAGGANR